MKDTLTIEYLETKNNLITVKVNKLFLHSKYNPVSEAQRIIKEKYDPDKLNILFGFGLGYLYEEVINQYNQENLIIIDPLFDLLKNNVIIEPVNLMTEINKNELTRTLHKTLKYYSRKINVICSPNYDRLCLKEYKEVLTILKNIQYSNIISENTIRFFSKQWQENYIQNLAIMDKFDTFNKLINKFNCPIVIASGGPSLIKQLPLLQKMKSKCIVIAAGSTINSLLKYGIIPDFVVSVDGGEANYNHFASLNVNSPSIIFSFSSNYKIQKNYKGKMYAFLLNDDAYFQKYLHKEYNVGLPRFVGGTSVANFALSCAVNMTTGPIALIGQDLAYTNHQTHAEGNKNFKEIDEELFKKKSAFEEIGYYGEKVWTDHLFIAMREEFEKIYAIYKDCNKIFNCTEGGLRIGDIPQITFRNYCNRYLVNTKEVKKKYDFKPLQSIDKIRKGLHKEIDIYNKVIGLLNNSLVELKKEEYNNYFSENLLNKLEKVDEQLKKIQEETSINYILEPILLDVMIKYEEKSNETYNEKFRRSFNQNMELYTESMKAIIATKKYIENMLSGERNESYGI